MRGFLSAVAVIYLLGPPAAAQTLDVPFVSRPPRIDGVLDDLAWWNASRVSHFVQSQPKEGAVPTEKTIALVARDFDNLYVAFYALDSDTSAIRAHLYPRDQALTDDYVGVWLDTFGDHRRAYELYCNPIGIQLDWFNNAGVEDISPDYVWSCAAALRSDGYTVEMKIPFKSLRYPPSDKKPWRIALARTIERKNESVGWPPYYESSGTALAQMTELGGLSSLPSPTRLELIPELTGTSSKPYERQDNAFHIKNTNVRAGVNAKLGLTPNWTANGTYNPDFSQVEADVPQVQVNQRFPLYFPEKRPFFQEGVDYFSTPLNLLYTRNIVDPEYGAKLSGKQGAFSAAFLRARDRVDGGSTYNVARLKQDVGEESVVGEIVSDRQLPDGSYNRAAGADGLLHLGPVTTFEFQAVDSWTRELGTGTVQGPAYHAALVRPVSRGLGFDLVYDDISPRFFADSGFIPRSDIRQGVGELFYSYWPENSWLLTVKPDAGYTRIYDHESRLTDSRPWGGLTLTFPLQTSISYTYYPRTLERFGDVDFRKKWSSLVLASEPTPYFSASVTAGKGDAIDYDADVPFLGKDFEGSVTATVKPTSRLSYTSVYLKSRLDTADHQRVFDENIWQHKVVFQWTKELSSRVIYQYDTLGHGGFADALLTYLVSPGTAFYLGYDVSLARDPDKLVQIKKTVFGKISYLFRL